eukprot:TRINITY_DN15119_c0_g1_i1.p1 TRINITY_DN15119_c0_g1~~TRINITY_DN15119_c0_g1_i1.p1  ORF type:complete len:482 (+),score=71.63 TRINITY_DN15119_c0_g1_i1:41-1447(+)
MPNHNGDESNLANSLLVLVFGCALLLGHWCTVAKMRFIQESGLTICLGMLFGAAVGSAGELLLILNGQTFFQWLLPPIIFSAGFSCKRQHFFANFNVILLFGVLGTVVNFLLIAVSLIETRNFFNIKLHNMELLSFAAVLSATDSVAVLSVIPAKDHPTLYGILSGEGVLNDAIAVVLLRSIGKTVTKLTTVAGVIPAFDWDASMDLLFSFCWVGWWSVVVGCLCGAFTALLLHALQQREALMEAKRELALLIITAYVSNSVAEHLGLSGIVSLFVCGAVMSNYTLPTMNPHAAHSAEHTFETIAYLCEVLLFLALGYYATLHDKVVFAPAFVASTVLILVVSRGVTVLVLFCLLYFFAEPLNPKHAAMLWWTGLIRGSLAFALSFTTPGSSGLLISTTFGVVIITVFVFGGLSPLVVDALGMESCGGEGSWTGTQKSLASRFRRIDEKAQMYLGGARRDAETTPLLS